MSLNVTIPISSNSTFRTVYQRKEAPIEFFQIYLQPVSRAYCASVCLPVCWMKDGILDRVVGATVVPLRRPIGILENWKSFAIEIVVHVMERAFEHSIR